MRRDPRVEPKKGDIIRFGNVFDSVFYEVLDRDPRMRANDVSSFSEGLERQFSLKQWKEFTKDAEVIRVVGETCS